MDVAYLVALQFLQMTHIRVHPFCQVVLTAYLSAILSLYIFFHITCVTEKLFTDLVYPDEFKEFASMTDDFLDSSGKWKA